jgi:hypothetical protein
MAIQGDVGSSGNFREIEEAKGFFFFFFFSGQ